MSDSDSDLVFGIIGKDVEHEARTKVILRHMLFGFTTALFLLLIVFTIQDLLTKKVQSNLLFFTLFMVVISGCVANIIINLTRYKEILDRIKILDETSKMFNNPPEKYIYTKTLFIYPIISFIFILLLIIILIIFNHRCAIKLNNIHSSYASYYRL